ncbi:Ribonuclease P protein component [Sinobacterium norvegicum]|uniref:Ribonuclease P protein component n=1 Tax=Sinobacterium norvegicum TaxID=1641715 RepID=A0ABM9AIG8_9GAMM|nr:ribonuclease P protein component [Sinobacterium norvegicum]CAH0993023.1 Ribonuclease P protein component [Sinobacterium norvegicum]
MAACPEKTYGFGRELRLLTALDYKTVFDDAQLKVACPQLLILARRSSSPRPRLGLIIAKKNVKLACTRNRLKRLLRESFRHQQHQLPELDIVVMARRGLADMDNSQVHKLIDKQWKRLCKRTAQST